MFPSRSARRSRHTASIVISWSLFVMVMAALVAAPAAAAEVSGCAGPGRTVAEEPWPQRGWAPAAAGDGGSVLVAVVDSGVDDDHPQLRGAVNPGLDLLDGSTDGRTDCLGHGTAVASVIAARPVAGAGLRGVAPGVRILPVRVSERIGGRTDGADLDPAKVAAAIDHAVDKGAKVINLSLAVYRDHSGLRRAVRTAIEADVVVVAAAGNAFAAGNPTPYPAAYEGVLGVGAVDRDGRRHPDSAAGSYVDVVAAGVDVVGAAPGRGHQPGLAGTSFAVPFVAGTAALVRAAHPALTPDQVVRRIQATADPLPGPKREYGAGAVNPARAVTEYVPARPRPATKPHPLPALEAVSGRSAPSATTATTVGLGLLAAAGAVTAIATATPHARRRRWRP
jgi:type VII secretion-associated serine protease mycosin